MAGGFQATNTGIPAAIRRAARQMPNDPTALLKSIAESLESIEREYVQPKVFIRHQGALSTTATPATAVSQFFDIKDPVRLIVVQAVVGTIELVFGQDYTALETFQVDDTMPTWITLPWGNLPVQMYIRNPSATVAAQYGVLLIGGNV